METGNKYLVGVQGDSIIILKPPGPRDTLSRADALLLAAWLVVMAEEDTGEFEAVHTAVCQS